MRFPFFCLLFFDAGISPPVPAAFPSLSTQRGDVLPRISVTCHRDVFCAEVCCPGVHTSVRTEGCEAARDGKQRLGTLVGRRGRHTTLQCGWIQWEKIFQPLNPGTSVLWSSDLKRFPSLEGHR